MTKEGFHTELKKPIHFQNLTPFISNTFEFGTSFYSQNLHYPVKFLPLNLNHYVYAKNVKFSSYNQHI